MRIDIDNHVTELDHCSGWTGCNTERVAERRQDSKSRSGLEQTAQRIEGLIQSCGL